MPETTLCNTSDFPETSNFRKTSEFHKTSDFQQTFSSFSLAHPGVCRISIFEPVHPRLGLFPVIVASQLAESIAGIANFIDDIAGKTLRSRQGCPHSSINLLPSKVSDDPRLGPVLIQHYPENLKLHRLKEHFSVVTFQMKPEKNQFSDEQIVAILSFFFCSKPRKTKRPSPKSAVSTMSQKTASIAGAPASAA